MMWQCGNYTLDLKSPKIMAVINVTENSFSDGGDFLDPWAACRRIDEALNEGAHILDLGAESSRPGAKKIDDDLEWSRLKPILNYACQQGVPVSVDTYKPQTMKRALEAGASIINDIKALSEPGALEILANNSTTAGICLMHMIGNPQTMQVSPHYESVSNEVKNFLQKRIESCLKRGIKSSRIAIDPGIGFGKTLQHNLEIMDTIPHLTTLGYPVLIGASRKSFLGVLASQPEAKNRLAASISAALFAINQGAKIIRVHDVRATLDAVTVWQKLLGMKHVNTGS